MRDVRDTDARRAVGAALAKMSDAWRSRRYDELNAFFDEDAVLVPPGMSGRIAGRDAIVDSYREFMERASLLEYSEDTPVIDVWGDVAVASYRWRMRWSGGGEATRAAGCDIFVLRRAADAAGAEAWRAVWRTMTLDDTAG